MGVIENRKDICVTEHQEVFNEEVWEMIRHIDERACVGCGICALICPGDVIVMDETNKARIKYPQDCWTCFSCEMACPVKAVDVHPFRKPKPMAW